MVFGRIGVADMSRSTISTFKLFELFLTHRGQILSREYLASCISDKDNLDERTIDVHIMRLRKNLRLRKWKDPITTVRDTGYQFCKG
jgi:two-component system phosphate regulon response regulator PhoB